MIGYGMKPEKKEDTPDTPQAIRVAAMRRRLKKMKQNDPTKDKPQASSFGGKNV